MLFVIEGLPRTGKTTIAADISRRLGIPHDNSRPPPGADIDSFVFGKCELHTKIDWSTFDLIMDRQLPSSFAYAMLYRGDASKSKNVATRYYAYDYKIPCVYLYIRTNNHRRIHESTSKKTYHAQKHSKNELQMLQVSIENFMAGSVHPVHTFDLPDNPTKKDFDIIREQIILVINSYRPNWDKYFMMHAEIASKRSTCLSRHVGAVLVEDNRIIGVGYSGPPRGAKHCTECARRDCNSGEMLHDSRAVHAEVNSVLNATKLPKNGTLYCTTQPCFECSKMLINSGVTRVVYKNEYPDEKRDAIINESSIIMEMID